MKNLLLILFFVFSPFTIFAQQLSGLWIGTLTNDSTSIRQDQSFEIVLSEYKSKVTGYSRSTFIVNDTLYYIVKRVKGVIENGVCEVKDDEIVSSNFPKRIEKGVKVIHTFRMNRLDSSWQLDGEWKTTQTKKYYSVSGKSDLEEENDIDNSKIFPHLEELSLGQDVPFYVKAKKEKEEAIREQIAANRKNPTGILPELQSGVNNSVVVNRPASSVKTNTLPVDNTITMPEEKVVSTNIAPEHQTVVKRTETAGAKTVKNNTVVAETGAAVKDEAAKQIVKSGITVTEPVKTEATNPEKTTGHTGLAKTDEKKLSAAPVAEKTSDPAKGKDENVLTVSGNQVNDQKETESKVANGSNDVAARTAIAEKRVTDSNSIVSKTAGNTKTTLQPESQNTDVTVRTGIANTRPVSPVNNDKQKNVSENSQTIGASGKNVVTPTQPAEKINAGFISEEQSRINLANTVGSKAGAALKFNERKTDAQQEVLFKADSLVIAVYDNGEVDGDTVSVLLNGEVIMARQGLKTTAVKQTIYFPAGTEEEFTLVLYAENLGRYPPNTGLLVIYDGEERHYVRFSADLQRNAAVVLKRKRQ